MPALDTGILIGDICGLILALPVALFLAFWISAVKSRFLVVLGALIGALIAFFVILACTTTLLSSTPVIQYANGAEVFFGSLLMCSVLALVGGIATDLLVASKNSRDYRRQVSH